MNIPEGAQEADFNGRRLAAGRLGGWEVYATVVWRGVRYLFVFGKAQARLWFRYRTWGIDTAAHGR